MVGSGQWRVSSTAPLLGSSVWPAVILFADRQAKAIAGQLGVHVESPELLRYGLFTDRNAGNHIYRWSFHLIIICTRFCL